MAFEFGDALDIFKTGVGVYSTTVKANSDKDTAAAAAEIEQAKVQQAQIEYQQQLAANAQKEANNKKIIPIIAVVSVAIIGGIGFWWYMKKKKIS